MDENIISPQELQEVVKVITTYISQYTDSIRSNLNLDTKSLKRIRLYECFCEGTLRDMMYGRDDSLDIQEVDSRNSPSLPRTFYEKVCELYNNDQQIIYTKPYPKYHYMFKSPRAIKNREF